MQIETRTRKTKECPFCAEIIQAKAIKCRYCGEYLNTNKAAVLRKRQEPDEEELPEEEVEAAEEEIFFEASPSLLSMLGFGIKTAFVAAVGILIWASPIENLIHSTIASISDQPLSDKAFNAIINCKITLGLGLIIFALILTLWKILTLKTMHYEVSADRIEYSRGIFDRRVDNIDMFRVVDLKMRRTLIDCILGIGSIEIITNDKTDPTFEFEKIKQSRKLYDIIKKASLEADSARGVIHLE